MRLIDAEPIERELFKRADKSLAKNSYENARIRAFRQALELILNAPTITPPPNDPLTLDELREMDGEPVWVVEGTLSYHALMNGVFGTVVWFIARWGEREMQAEDCGKTWSAYRRKLGGGQ